MRYTRHPHAYSGLGGQPIRPAAPGYNYDQLIIRKTKIPSLDGHTLKPNDLVLAWTQQPARGAARGIGPQHGGARHRPGTVGGRSTHIGSSAQRKSMKVSEAPRCPAGCAGHSTAQRSIARAVVSNPDVEPQCNLFLVTLELLAEGQYRRKAGREFVVAPAIAHA